MNGKKVITSKELLVARKTAAKLLGSLGGKSKSPAKKAASAKNGKLGGRPKKPVSKVSK